MSHPGYQSAQCREFFRLYQLGLGALQLRQVMFYGLGPFAHTVLQMGIELYEFSRRPPGFE